MLYMVYGTIYRKKNQIRVKYTELLIITGHGFHDRKYEDEAWL